MHLNLLVTIGDDPSALFGVRFVSSFFKNKSRVGVTLYSTVPRGAEVWEEEKSFDSLRDQDAGRDKLQADHGPAIDIADNRGVDANCARDSRSRPWIGHASAWA